MWQALLIAISLLVNSAWAEERVDLVSVKKGSRKMYLMSKGEIVKSYTISLGEAPEGHKVQEGDKRTPEGRYRIDYRNPNSLFHLSLHISYPNAEDYRRAEKLGVPPGGMIMIHGLPNHWRWTESTLQRKDWTNGCIAVTNQEIEEIWALVKDGTPVVIDP